MPRLYKDRVMELAEIVGIKDSLFRPIRKMSGGMQRKLEIIRSLVHTPEVLFLDEPTQGLDALSRRNLWEYINRTRKEYGTTIFLTTHYLDEAENVDTLCIINQGKIDFTGSPEEMKKNLLRRELILDAGDRAGLEKELKNMGVDYGIEKHIIVPSGGDDGCFRAQNIISTLKTPLTYLNTREPSLEDAYVELIDKKAVDKKGDAA
jgi:ABC-2 type transport system ATP-binding protein